MIEEGNSRNTTICQVGGDSNVKIGSLRRFTGGIQN